MLPEICEFSSGYYMVNGLYIEPHHDDEIAVEENFYGYIQDVYGNQPTPVLMKHANRHFTVEPSDGVAIDTVAVPSDDLDAWDVENPPSRESVLLAKPKTAHRLNQSYFINSDDS